MAQDLTVMIVGSGAREHALSHAYEESPQVGRIIVSPGNDFIAFRREKEVLIDKNCSLKDPASILALAQKYKPDIVDVAQDDALALGTVDLLRENWFLAFGPTKDSARIEWDKKWSRQFMQRHDIPHPTFKYFTSPQEATMFAEHLYTRNPTTLLYTKATGLCAGKGALKSESLEQAIENIQKMKSFGSAGEVFLIEQGLVGEEFSSYAISDGEHYHIFKSAQDNKTVSDNDQGDQTGGMGAVSPAMVTAPYAEMIENELIAKAIKGMAAEGNPYRGILYLGGIMTEAGPMNIEYNSRWGDPECQAVLPSLQTDYVRMVKECLGVAGWKGDLRMIETSQDSKTRVCVVGASRGYPGDYSAAKGKEIFGLEEAMKMKDVLVFGAGIKIEDGHFYANGGRLFNIVGEGNNIVEAKGKADEAMKLVNIEGDNLHYRTDIGWRDAERARRG